VVTIRFGICPVAAIGERAGLLANLGYDPDPDLKRLGVKGTDLFFWHPMSRPENKSVPFFSCE
jgi:hypothetical protein